MTNSSTWCRQLTSRRRSDFASGHKQIRLSTTLGGTYTAPAGADALCRNAAKRSGESGIDVWQRRQSALSERRHWCRVLPIRPQRCVVAVRLFAHIRHGRPPGRRRTQLQLGLRHQFGHRHVHGPRDANHGHDSRVLPSSFDAAHVRAINRTAMREFFLADLALGPQPPDIGGHNVSNRAGPIALNERDHKRLTRL